MQNWNKNEVKTFYFGDHIRTWTVISKTKRSSPCFPISVRPAASTVFPNLALRVKSLPTPGLGLTRRVHKSLHFLFAKGLETKSFLVALLLVTGFVLDWMKAYLVYSPQNVRLFTLPFCLETEKSVELSLVCM